MVSVSNVELDGILGGSGDLEGDDLALGDGCCPLHLIKQPPPHPLASMGHSCRYPEYLKNFILGIIILKL